MTKNDKIFEKMLKFRITVMSLLVQILQKVRLVKK